MSSPPLRGSAEWSARREVVLLLELTGGNRRRAQWLWLQKLRTKAEASQLASATSPQARQQPAGCQAKPATARARVVPKPKKSAARLAKDRRRLNQKHLASKVWAYVRVASRLLAWSVRARTRCANRAVGAGSLFSCAEKAKLNEFVERAASLGLREAAAATVGRGGFLFGELPLPAAGPLRRSPILVGRLLVQQGPSRWAVARPPPAPAPLALKAPPPATQLAPSTPPSQQPPSRPIWNGAYGEPLAAAATAAAPAASRPKRDVPAASPSRAPAAPKKTRGAAVQAALSTKSSRLARCAPQPKLTRFSAQRTRARTLQERNRQYNVLRHGT